MFNNSILKILSSVALLLTFFFASVIAVSCSTKDSSLHNSIDSTTYKKEIKLSKVPDTSKDAIILPDSAGHQLIVYYFMSTYRCPSCIYIEKSTEDIVRNIFAEQVKNGRVIFKSLNIDKPENRHYEKDYKLYAQSVVLSDVRNGKEVRWTNLDKIWKLLNDNREFHEYIIKQINKYLGE
jgi:hypothetical protein